MNLNLYNPFRTQTINLENKFAQISKIINQYSKFKNNPDNFPTEIDGDGNKYWRNKEKQLHRLNGPAIIFKDGRKEWWVNGKRHRLDGPAVIYLNRKEYYWKGILIDKKSWKEKKYKYQQAKKYNKNDKKYR